MIKNEEGCRIFGSFEMDMVPGNFHVSYHANTVVFEKLMMQNSSLVQKLGANYRLESLSFGEGVSKSKLVRRLQNDMNVASLTNPYDGDPEFDTRNASKEMDFNNFIKIIPSQIIEKNKQIAETVYQFSMTSGQAPRQSMGQPQVMFSYEIDPITEVYKINSQSFLSLLVQVPFRDFFFLFFSYAQSSEAFSLRSSS